MICEAACKNIARASASRHERALLKIVFRRVPSASFDAALRFRYHAFAGWSSLVARRAHNPKVVGSNPAPATNLSSCTRGV